MSIEEVLKAVQGMNEKFDSLREDVDSLMSKRDRSRSPLRNLPAPVRRTESGRPASYADAARRDQDWGDRDPSETVDFSVPVGFSDEEEEGGRDPIDQLVEVSEETGKLLKDSCTRSVPNEVRRRVRSNFKLPKVPATRTPRLDHFIRAEAPQATKSLDRDLARIQSFVLDALAPLTALAERGDATTKEELRLATTSAIQLLGNASARISRLRREKVVQAVNKSLLPMVKEDAPYVDASPDLFGPEFAKKSKDFIDQVKALRSSLPSTSSSSRDHHFQERRSLFRKGNPSGKGGAYKRGGAYQNSRGGGRGGRQTHHQK